MTDYIEMPTRGTLTPEGMLMRDGELFHRMSKGKDEKWVCTKVFFEYLRNGWKDITFVKYDKRKSNENQGH